MTKRPIDDRLIAAKDRKEHKDESGSIYVLFAIFRGYPFFFNPPSRLPMVTRRRPPVISSTRFQGMPG